MQCQQHMLASAQQHHSTSEWFKGNCREIQQHCVRIMLRRALDMMRVVLDLSLFSRTLFYHSLRQDVTEIVLRAQHTVWCQAIGRISPLYNHATRHGNIWAFPAKGTQGNKSTSYSWTSVQ